MSAIEKRNQYAAQILAGFAANPAIFAHNSQCGWSLVNCTDDEIAAYAVRLANALLGASDAIGLVSACEREGCNETRAIGGHFCPRHEA